MINHSRQYTMMYHNNKKYTGIMLAEKSSCKKLSILITTKKIQISKKYVAFFRMTKHVTKIYLFFSLEDNFDDK